MVDTFPQVPFLGRPNPEDSSLKVSLKSGSSTVNQNSGVPFFYTVCLIQEKDKTQSGWRSTKSHGMYGKYFCAASQDADL